MERTANNYPTISKCSVCKEIRNVRHIPIYVIGSEGLYTCHQCEMFIGDAIRVLMGIFNTLRRKLNEDHS